MGYPRFTPHFEAYGALFDPKNGPYALRPAAPPPRDRPLSELLAEFGKPKHTWTGAAEVPLRFSDALPDSGPTNCTFYHYAREGIPYWSILLAIDPTSSNLVLGTVTRP